MRGKYEVWAIMPRKAPPNTPDEETYKAVFYRYGPTLEEAEAYIEEHANDGAFYNVKTEKPFAYLVVVEGGTW